MKISEFCKNYTDGSGASFPRVLEEVGEMLVEVFRLDFVAVKEEFHDVGSFVQIWLHSKYGYDKGLWKWGLPSCEKFIARRAVWNQLYVKVGLPENVTNFCGNYKKKEKVLKHLVSLGVEESVALLAFAEVVQ
tara:strand:- start:1143 stop:1541 length:399 start_codon:yes stop_codon:yes gene_type:complete